MPRAIWSVAIAFGLVNIPVRMYSAIDEKDNRFHYVHEKDDSPIGYEKICKKEDKPVPNDEIVKAYQEDGEYIYMTDEDFEAAEERGYRAIDIADFVPYDDIDPIYFEKTYFPRPAGGRREGLCVALQGDGEFGPGRDRQARDAGQAAPRLPEDPRRRDHARKDVLRGRDPPGEGHRAEVRQSVARHSGRPDRPVRRRLRGREVRGHVPEAAAQDHPPRSA
jgi:hypothetical protein